MPHFAAAHFLNNRVIGSGDCMEDPLEMGQLLGELHRNRFLLADVIIANRPTFVAAEKAGKNTNTFLQIYSTQKCTFTEEYSNILNLLYSLAPIRAQSKAIYYKCGKFVVFMVQAQIQNF